MDFLEVEILNLFKDTGRTGSMDIENGYNGAVSSIISKSCEGEIKQRIHEQFPELTRIEVEGKYEFYICDLIPKSLLVDSKSTGNT